MAFRKVILYDEALGLDSAVPIEGSIESAEKMDPSMNEKPKAEENKSNLPFNEPKMEENKINENFLKLIEDIVIKTLTKVKPNTNKSKSINKKSVKRIQTQVKKIEPKPKLKWNKK